MNIRNLIYRSNIAFLLIVELLIIVGITQALFYKDNLKFVITSPCVENRTENNINFNRLFFSSSLARSSKSTYNKYDVTFNGVYLKYFDTLVLIGRLNCTPVFVRVEITEQNTYIDPVNKGSGCVYLSP